MLNFEEHFRSRGYPAKVERTYVGGISPRHVYHSKVDTPVGKLGVSWELRERFLHLDGYQENVAALVVNAVEKWALNETLPRCAYPGVKVREC